jgi:hypothetical protein
MKDSCTELVVRRAWRYPSMRAHLLVDIELAEDFGRIQKVCVVDNPE